MIKTQLFKKIKENYFRYLKDTNIEPLTNYNHLVIGSNRVKLARIESADIGISDKEKYEIECLYDD